VAVKASREVVIDAAARQRRYGGGTELRGRFGRLARKYRLNRRYVEPMTGIEPAYSAWEAISMPERVSDNAW
jgi:hypothetical protein